MHLSKVFPRSSDTEDVKLSARYPMIETYLLRKSLGLRSLGNKRGQTLVEYALILAFISVVAISVLMAMGDEVAGTYTTIDRQLTDAQNGGSTSAPARGH